MFEVKYKALSGYAEWFWLMAKNYKDIENRNWSLYRYIKPMELPIRVYLHASKTPASREEIDFIHRLIDQTYWEDFCAVDWEAIRGHIIGEITITGDVTASKSVWFFGTHGFLVKDGVLYDNPIPCRGKLGFFTPELTEVTVFGFGTPLKLGGIPEIQHDDPYEVHKHIRG